ncbi:MAG: YdbL family protein [Candidatus Hydrogenedentes bacterium]|nr:YdbL family protein [Candidatus Hydrogenedentota bacterium]
MKKVYAICIAMLLLYLNCVIQTRHTIEAHITLDIRHIQEQAGTLLDYVEKKTDELPVDESNTSKKKVSREYNLSPFPKAYAQTLVTVSPLAKEIADRMRNRYEKIEEAKNQGCLTENNRGYLELRECAILTDPDQKNEIQRLLSEENKDRKALYREIANLNKNIPDMSVSKVELIYAYERIQRAKPGHIVQLPEDPEFFQKLKDTALCQKLGDKCQPGAWVTIP